MTAQDDKPPVLVLTSAMRRDAFQIDRNRAAMRRDMRAVHRIEAEAARATTEALRMAVRA